MSGWFKQNPKLSDQEVKNGDSEEESNAERVKKMCLENIERINEAGNAIKVLLSKMKSESAISETEIKELSDKIHKFFEIKDIDKFFVAMLKGFYKAGGKVDDLSKKIEYEFDSVGGIIEKKNGTIEIKQPDGTIKQITLKNAEDDLSNYACEKSPMHPGGGLQKGGLFVIDDIIVGACASIIASAGVAMGSAAIAFIIFVYLCFCLIVWKRFTTADTSDGTMFFDRFDMSGLEKIITVGVAGACIPLYGTFFASWLVVLILKSPFMFAEYCSRRGGKLKTARKRFLIKKSKAKKSKKSRK